MVALLLLWAGASEAATLEDRPCPFAENPTTHIAMCHRMTRQDSGVEIAFDIAVLAPVQTKSVGHVIYVPGGPGDAPVSEDGLFDSLLGAFRDHTIILFNPRGTAGTTPRMRCDFGGIIWKKSFGGKNSARKLRKCIHRFTFEGPYPELFTSKKIADDVDAMVKALEVTQAGLYAISYGTEATLHLLAQSPRWLEFAILDSVSLPGQSSVHDEMVARDRFLAALDDLCFVQGNCSTIARGDAANLTEWTAQFDEAPLELFLSDGNLWDFDAVDVMDYLGGLGSYPDGLDIAVGMIERLETSRLSALGWMSIDIAANREFTVANVELLLQAYADTYEFADIRTARKLSQYKRNRATVVDQIRLQQIWRGGRPREVAFVDPTLQTEALDMPVLVMSGALDTSTPVEWAQALNQRFTGVDYVVYPSLGHAVSAGPLDAITVPELSEQLRCASRAVRVFIDPTLSVDEECKRYDAGEIQ